jgi:GntR family transcriptional regulator
MTFPIRSLNKNSSVPLYSQLHTLLVEKIRSGALLPGDKVPAERELAETLHVSRITARQALDALVESGLVYRERGRGTFVAEPKMRGVMGFSSFSADMRSRGLNPSSVVISQALVPPDEKLRKILKLGEQDLALHLVRLRLADEMPVALQSAYLSYRLVQGLEHEDLRFQSLYSVLREKYYINPAWTEAEMEALSATAEEAGHLRIEKNDPVLVVRGITFTDSFEIVESVRTVYRGKGLALYIGRQRIQSDHF